MPRSKTANSSPSHRPVGFGRFWHRSLWPVLWPLSLIWRLATWLRWQWVRPTKLNLPIIVVGNATVGGQGKTPSVLAIAKRLESHFRNEYIFCLSRGYGGEAIGPIEVIPAAHRAEFVGDEPLLLAAQFRTIVSLSRPEGARLAAELGARIIVMDDGLQNPHIRPDLAILVVDGGSDSSNLGIVPTGPFREPLAAALRRVQAVILIGEDRGQWRGLIEKTSPNLAVLDANLVPDQQSFALVSGKRIVAFAGIGRPEKFFDSLRRSGAELVETYGFADHHPYQAAEIDQLKSRAAALEATLITTTKDFYRLDSLMRQDILPFAVNLEFNDAKLLYGLIMDVAKRVTVDENN
ncbi:MAG: tetraacyldisaccharide 4'-kinase [Candidatus Pacebacteria bacterium]|nr:tetraacyldisaccharide 4'-kinase [Candidatus Paceibacterota bacterium]